MTIEKLKDQLAATETQYEDAKAVVYRIDGAIQMLKHILAETESEAPPAAAATSPAPDPPVE